MSIHDKYIWIWKLNASSDGDISTLVQKAKDLGISGYILKTHDGSSFWQQASAITEFKSAGLKCGSWGYCYGSDVSGEVDAIKKTLSLNPDFYVLDVESEFEQSNMDKTAEQLLSQIKGTGIPLGYSSFAIPSYHSVPFAVFSKYCSFTMPQVYWAEMGWPVDTAFKTSYQQYSQYNIPVYPIGQITSDVSAQDLQEFEKLCSENNTAAVSYWNYQAAGVAQFQVIKDSSYMSLTQAVQILQNNGIISSPDYWLQNAAAGGIVKGEYAQTIINKTAQKLISLTEAVQILQNNGIISSPDYWLQNAVMGGSVKGEYAQTLIINSAQKLTATT